MILDLMIVKQRINSSLFEPPILSLLDLRLSFHFLLDHRSHLQSLLQGNEDRFSSISASVDLRSRDVGVKDRELCLLFHFIIIIRKSIEHSDNIGFEGRKCSFVAWKLMEIASQKDLRKVWLRSTIEKMLSCLFFYNPC